jgi:hypothetical protein
MQFWVRSYRKNSFHKREKTKMKKFKIQKSSNNCKINFSFPPKRETLSFLQPLTTGVLLLTVLRLSLLKNSTKNLKILPSISGEITTSIPKPNNSQKNPGTKTTGPSVSIWSLSPSGTSLKMCSQKTRKESKKLSQLLD